jgi:hypothetical protein
MAKAAAKKTTRKVKGPKSTSAKKAAGKGGNGRALGKGDNGGSAEAIAAGFHQFRGQWNQIQAKLKAANKELRDMIAEAKNAGYQKQEFAIADMLSAGPKKEAKIIAAVETRLRVARWMGHAMGKQMDLFADFAKEKAADPQDAAYEAGQQAAREGQKAEVPGQYSSQELSQAWLSGYHVEQERIVKAGIKPLEAKPDDAPPAGWGPSKQGEAQA